MNLNLKMLRNDFRRNRSGNVSLLLFMALATGLVVAATIVVTQLFVSMTEMYQVAKPPHFLQMHIGKLDQRAIDDFNASYPGIVATQTVPMIDVHGEDLTVFGPQRDFDLSGCRLDIGLVRQNKGYDLLLDGDRNPIVLERGEIGIPVILLDAYDIELGDTVVLERNGVHKSFSVARFVHDAQMNSTLCSSTRLLLSDADFNELFGEVGEIEYLVEVYFSDTSLAAEYQSSYENAGLPQNGQAVTYTAIFLLSALTDIMLAMVFIAVSVLLVLVALLCIKYTVMASMEEEVGEIGTMKAIGISDKDIRSLYLGKIRLLVLVGIVLGYLCACLLAGSVTGHVSGTFGRQPVSSLTIGIPLVACVLLFLITDHHCKRILRKLRRLTVVDALVTGRGFGRKDRVRDGLHRSRRLPIDLLLSLREVSLNFNGFIIIFIVLMIVSMILIVPMNLLHTMESKEFISYMGSPSSDLLIELDPGEGLEYRYGKMKDLLSGSSEVQVVDEFRRVRVSTTSSEGRNVVVHADCGPVAGQGLQYLVGAAPSRDDEIAFSALNVEAIGVSVGEAVVLAWGGGEREFIVCGIYQDVTSGGYTAKSQYGFENALAEKYIFTVDLSGAADPKDVASRWRGELGGGYSIEPMEEFLHQTLGGVTRQVKMAAMSVVLIGLCISALIILLFSKLRLAKDASRIAIQKAIGFTDSDIRRQYLYKIGFVSLIGVFCGTLLANLFGDDITSFAFASMGLGISRITFIVNPWVSYLLLPVGFVVISLLTTWLSTRQVKDCHIITLINE